MSYLPYEPQQQALLPQALQDWLPEGHLACFVSHTEMDRRAAQRLDQARAGLAAIQLAWLAPRERGMEARVHGAEPAADGHAERQLSEVACLRDADWSLPHGGRLEGAVEQAGAPSRRGLGGAVH